MECGAMLIRNFLTDISDDVLHCTRRQKYSPKHNWRKVYLNNLAVAKVTYRRR